MISQRSNPSSIYFLRPEKVLSALLMINKCYYCYLQGTVGFRNARRGTNIAAQAAGLALGEVSKISSWYSVYILRYCKI